MIVINFFASIMLLFIVVGLVTITIGLLVGTFPALIVFTIGIIGGGFALVWFTPF